MTTVNHPLAIVDFKDGADRIFDYFILNKGDGKFLDFTKPVAIAQSGYNKKNITTTDFLKASIGVPVFSASFKEKMEAELKDDLEFVECTVNCQGESFTFYAGKINTHIDLVDKEKSAYRTLTDGSSRLMRAVYREEFAQSFLIARDAEIKAKNVVSEDFKKLVEERGLKIGFLPAV